MDETQAGGNDMPDTTATKPPMTSTTVSDDVLEAAQTIRKKKHGNRSWKPAQMLELHDKKPGLHYRWTDATEDLNVKRRLAEGWDFVTNVKSNSAKHNRPNKATDGRPLTSTTDYAELTLMAIPEEEYQEHRAFYREQTRRQTLSIKGDFQGQLDQAARQEGAPRAQAHGKIVIE